MNTRLEKGVKVRCNRFLSGVTPGLAKFIKDHPGEKLTLRCPTCPPYQRWIEVYSKNGKLTWEVVEDKPDFKREEDLEFDSVIKVDHIA